MRKRGEKTISRRAIGRQTNGVLHRRSGSIPFAEDAVAAYYCALDRQTPLAVRAALWGALAYFVMPFDVIPDYLPLIGYTDDAAVLATAIRMVASHMLPEHREAARRALKKLEGGTN